ncbi:hypothetical protein Hanom_Chr07g00585891 [Helianthus anomalus]
MIVERGTAMFKSVLEAWHDLIVGSKRSRTMVFKTPHHIETTCSLELPCWP